MKPEVKPREQWDVPDLRDFIDGWHEETDPHFKSQRDRMRVVSYEVEREGDVLQGLLDDFVKPEPEYRTHMAGVLFKLGRDYRIAHRDATGI